MASSTLFRAYTEMPERVPSWAWRAIRWLVLACSLGVAVTAMVRPSVGLAIFWAAYVPSLPLVFLVAPGLWRNICPMAALNQVPRTLGFTRGWSVPVTVQQYTPLISAALFLLIVPFRRVLLDRNGLALGIFILVLLSLAFIGGVLFKGKSGWCTQFCPMLQIERFYGQNPLLVVRNSHCRPCVGCNKNCYDFNPTAAYLADLHDSNPKLALNRALFAGALPWFIGAFFTQPDLSHVTVSAVLLVYGRMFLFAAAGMGVFTLIQHVTGLSAQKVVLLHVVAAINLFYWFVAPLALGQLGVHGSIAPAVVQLAVAAASLLWLRLSWPREQQFLNRVQGAPARVADSVLRVRQASRQDKAEVVFADGPSVLAPLGHTLLELAEANHVAMESGCRMGMCGADPIYILEGEANLSPVVSVEEATLERLGLPSGCRMACCARVQGPVKVGPVPAAVQASAEVTAVTVNPEVERVVVVGNGVAGVTTATGVRKLHPGAQITVIGSESYDFYNRMAISKLVCEATAIDKLYLLPDDWAASRHIRYLRGVAAVSIDPTERTVATELGESIPYDRLVLATGSACFIPALEGFGLPGSFSMRTIDDAVEMQQYIRRRRCRTAVVIGGGLLGLEAAYSIHEMDVRTFVLDRASYPLNRQLDPVGGAIVWQKMYDLGIQVLSNSIPSRILGEERVTGVELADGRVVPADLCLVATGIAPRTELALSAGLAVNTGVVVNDELQTSDPAIYAAGDVSEHQGRIYGLWPACVEQAGVAAVNLLGGTRRYEPLVPPTQLKVPGIDLLSVGEIAANGDGHELHFEVPSTRKYRKLVLREGRVYGAILVGHPELSDAVKLAVERHRDVSAELDRLEAGDWSVLGASMPVPA